MKKQKKPVNQLRIVIESDVYSCDSIVGERRALMFLKAFRRQYPNLLWHKAADFLMGDRINHAWFDVKRRKEVLSESLCTISITKA